MTTAEQGQGPGPEGNAEDLRKLEENLGKLEQLTQRLSLALTAKRPVNPALEGPGSDLMLKASAAYMTDVMANPAKILEQQIGYWGKALKHYVEAQQAFSRGTLRPPQDPGPKDRRFANPLWDSHPWFNFLKQQYLLSADAVRNAVAGLDHLEPRDRKRIDYFTRQMLDMMAPTNFLATNPDALERAIATDGQSLVKGLENLVRDIEANQGDLLVTLADPDAFTVGENIGTSQGSEIGRAHV